MVSCSGCACSGRKNSMPPSFVSAVVRASPVITGLAPSFSSPQFHLMDTNNRDYAFFSFLQPRARLILHEGQRVGRRESSEHEIPANLEGAVMRPPPPSPCVLQTLLLYSTWTPGSTGRSYLSNRCAFRCLNILRQEMHIMR